MEPQPVKTELPPKKNPETKPGKAPETKPPQQEKATSTPDMTTPRGKLEAIANGTPASEVFAEPKPKEPKEQQPVEHAAETATTPQKIESSPESAPDKETMTKLLEESNALLLELRDMRLLVSAVATQAADTPLGNETRMDTLRMIRDMGHEALPPDQIPAVTKLQEKIMALNLPEATPQNSALIPIITKYNEMHPEAAVPQQVIDQIKSGQRDSATAVSQFMQSNPNLAQDVWKQLTNVDGFTGLHPTPENILQLSGLETTPENMKKAQEMFGAIVAMNPQEQIKAMDVLGPKLLTGALIMIFVTQMATGQEGGGGGH